jgi:glycosyltransferase involved in cell wall biosynthesis
MPSSAKVSIAIITYNQLGFIAEAIHSAANQTYTNFEIVVADDGSTDGTQEIVIDLAQRYPNVIPVLSSHNCGIAANMNRALKQCTGEYVAWLGGDDLMLPDKLRKQVNFLEMHTNCATCMHDMDIFDSTTGKSLRLRSDIFDMKSGGIEVMLNTNWFLGRTIKYLPSSEMVRAEAIPKHGFDERLRYANDWLCDIEILTKGQLGYIPDVLGRYRKHDKQVTADIHALNLFLEEAMIVLGIAAARYPQYGRLIRNKRNYLLFQHLVFDWIKQEARKDVEAQFRYEAGYFKSVYMKLVYYFLHHPKLFEFTHPLRSMTKRLLAFCGRV